jgi:hypothetical protein
MIFNYFTLAFFLVAPFSADIADMNSFSNTKKSTTNFSKYNKDLTIENSVESVYFNLQKNQFSLPKLVSFAQALNGFYKLKEEGKIKKDIVTLIDFSLPSSMKRLWVIDLATKTILFQSLVAHGRNTGEEFANSFSNTAQSLKSSLGFYSTGEVYAGKHGLSLRLDGLEKGINDNARNRGVVMHAADYVSNSFVKNNKRLGRSQGCPALPVALSKDIISAIKDKSCLFIYHPKLVSHFVF